MSQLKHKYTVLCASIPVHIILFGIGGFWYLKRRQPLQHGGDDHVSPRTSSDEDETDVEENFAQSHSSTSAGAGKPNNLSDLEVVLREEGWLDTPWPTFSHPGTDGHQVRRTTVLSTRDPLRPAP